MILLSLLLMPMFGLLTISVYSRIPGSYLSQNYLKHIKFIGLLTSVLNLLVSLIIFIKFDFSYNQFQFVQKYHNISYYDFYLGIDGLSVYFILLTCIIMPISLLSNWTSISKNVKSYVMMLLLLETFLLLVFLALDVLLYYIFFESILFPLFILVGLYGSNNKIRASFYLFLYTLFGSLFLLLSIINIYNITGVTDFDSLFKINFDYYFQFFIFYGIFLSFAVKTPTIFLNNWLLKAHVESPLGGSLILASVVLKLSLYGIVRLILPILPKAYLDNSYIIYVIGVITIMYASIATLRTIDVKELIAYSSVSHAAVYFLGIFSNNIQGIQGAIIFGLAHGFVSSGLFICTGGILYDRSGNRLITIYRGLTQIMPIFSILFFILCLANAGAPLTFNFLGEFMCLYGAFERLPLIGIFASTSIVLSAAYSMYMLNRIIFGGSLSKLFMVNIFDINKREFFIVVILVFFTIFLGIYPTVVTDGLNYYNTNLIYNYDYAIYSFLFFFTRNKSSIFRYIFISAILAAFIGFSIRYLCVIYPIYDYIIYFVFYSIEFIQDSYIYKTYVYPYIYPYVSTIITTALCFIPIFDFLVPMGGDYKYNDTSPGHKIKQQDFAVSKMDNNNPVASSSQQPQQQPISGNNNIITPKFVQDSRFNKLGLNAGINQSINGDFQVQLTRVSPCTNFATIQATCKGKTTGYAIRNPNRIISISEKAKAIIESNNTLNNDVRASNEFIHNWALNRSDKNAKHNWTYYNEDQQPIDLNQTLKPEALESEPVHINSAINPSDNNFTDQFKRGYIAGGDNQQGLHNIRCALNAIADADAEHLRANKINAPRLKSIYFTANHERFILEHLKHTNIELYNKCTNNETTGLDAPSHITFRENFPYTDSFNESVNWNAEVLANIIIDTGLPTYNKVRSFILYKHELKKHLSNDRGFSDDAVESHLLGFDEHVKQYFINQHRKVNRDYDLYENTKRGLNHQDTENIKLTKKKISNHLSSLRSYYYKPNNVYAKSFLSPDVPRIELDKRKLHEVGLK